MALFVINEWLWADISGVNGPRALSHAVSFIEAIPRSEHKLVILSGSCFDQKAWALCKNQTNIGAHVAKIFVVDIRQNSDHVLIIHPESATNLPAELESKVKPDDQYLVRLLITVTGAILVTTDAPLREILNEFDLPSMSREQFLSEYFQLT